MLRMSVEKKLLGIKISGVRQKGNDVIRRLLPILKLGSITRRLPKFPFIASSGS